MNRAFDALGFSPADILLPNVADPTKWSVVACDQYTAQPDYWKRVAETVGEAPSTLKLILPESRLGDEDVAEAIAAVNQTMASYVAGNNFTELKNALIYVERKLEGGKTRRGLVGKIDLEEYDYIPGANALIRATEGTVLSRIPPRVAVRENAPIELPHVMLLADDPERMVIEPLARQTAEMRPLYDFQLMEQGGHITGWQLGETQCAQVAAALSKLAGAEVFAEKYHKKDGSVLLFAVGDGNHSLATAKECYERQKKETPPEGWAALPARYALVELVNLHDESLEFEPIHRVVFGVEPTRLLGALLAAYPGAYLGEGDGHVIRFCYGDDEGAITVPHPTAQLPVGTLQHFLDAYLRDTGATIDYIHGGDVTRALARQPRNIGFLLPAMPKESLFPTVLFDGVLPRKTFSMGEAHDKRFYLEARKIR